MEKPKRLEDQTFDCEDLCPNECAHAELIRKVARKYRIALEIMNIIMEAEPRILKAVRAAIKAENDTTIIQEVLDERNEIH